MDYSKHVSTKVTPQSEKIPGSKQVANSAGGFAFPVDDWVKLDRFLILGNEGGSYYADEKKMTIANADAVLRLLAVDGIRVVNRIVEVSDQGLAPKNDPAIFCLALCIKKGDVETRRAARKAVPKVCRIGTHIFQFAQAIKDLGGWGRLTAGAVKDWYLGQDAERLASNLVKYRNRASWTHKDLLRVGHPHHKGDRTKEALFRWVTREGSLGEYVVERKVKEGSAYVTVSSKTHESVADVKLPPIIYGFEQAKTVTDGKRAAELVRDYGLPREALPTTVLDDIRVWDALLTSGKGMPFTAMVRNLGKMSSIGLLKPLSDAEKFVVDKLHDYEGLRKARVHPLAILMAQSVYGSGRGFKGDLTWQPSKLVIDALNDAFYESFKFIEPTGKRHYLGIDISGSMDGGYIAGSMLTPRVGAAAMALVTARSEPRYHMAGFCTAARGSFGGRWDRGSAKMVDIDISPKVRLDKAVEIMQKMPMGGTDCALPMLDALERKLEVDVFVVYTDSETWAGHIHPTQALQKYRKETGIPAKLIVVGMVANEFTIADPDDAGMMDVVGFDSSAPAVMANFVR